MVILTLKFFYRCQMEWAECDFDDLYQNDIFVRNSWFIFLYYILADAQDFVPGAILSGLEFRKTRSLVATLYDSVAFR